MRYSLLLLARVTVQDGNAFDDGWYIDDPFEGIDWAQSLDDVPLEPLDFDWNLSKFDDENFSLFDSYSAVQDAHKPDQDINLSGPCKSDLANHPECDYSQNDKGLCLWMSHVETYKYGGFGGYSRPLSPECTDDLIQFFTNASEHPFEYFHDLRRECDYDLKTYCSNSSAQVSAITCLRSNMDSISSRSCIDELNHLNSWASLNESWWSPTLWRDCASERSSGSICEQKSSNLVEFRNCLDDHRFEITNALCRKSLFESDLQAAPNPYYLRRDVSDKCRFESKTFCSDVSLEDENQLFCLFRASKRIGDKVAANSGPSSFSAACSSAIQSVISSMDSDYRLNRPVGKFCRSTIETFCKDEKIDNDKMLHENSLVMNCLKRVFLFNEHHQGQQLGGDFMETDACMRTIRQSVLLSSLDWEADSALHSNCLQDYHKLLHRISANDTSLRDADSCAGESPHQCLQSHFHDLKNPECQKAVALHSQLEALDQNFKPQLLKACALALDTLDCHEAKSTTDCLYEQVEFIHDPFCRGAIRHDFDLSDRDYRLSYSLSLVCAKDRTALCSSVDPASVLKCMIDHVEDIKDPECEQDVSRLAFVAMSEEEDVVEKSVCASDVENFCSNPNEHNSVHSCLLNRLSELSPKCAETVLNLHSSDSALASMEKVLNNLCSPVLVSDDCRHETKSLNSKVDCIRRIEKTDISRVSRPCLDQLIAVESLLSADYRTNREIQTDCKTDLQSLCGDIDSNTHILDNPRLMCLVSNRLKIRNSHCKHHIVSTIYRMSDSVQYVPNMRSVCGDDITKYCKDVIPGNGELHDCLRENFSSISHDCQSQEFVIEQAEMLAGTTRSACAYELETVCSSAPDLHCLWRNVDEVASPCRDQVRKEMKGKIGNIWLDPVLYTRCRSTVNEFIQKEDLRDKCPSYLQQLPIPLNGLIPLPSNYTQAIGGEHVYCLGSFRSKISDLSCLKSVEKVIREEMRDPVLLQHGLENACKRDLSLKGVCGHTDPFDTAEQWRCLQDKFGSKLLTYMCSESVKKALKTSISDVQFNPEIESKCESEIDHFFCKHSISGVIPCLIRKYTLSVEDSVFEFSEQCAEAMKRLPELSDIDMDHVVLRAEEEEEERETHELSGEIHTGRLLGQEKDSITSTSIELSGSLAFVSLGSLFVVVAAGIYKIYRWRMNKGYMVIIDKA